MFLKKTWKKYFSSSKFYFFQYVLVHILSKEIKFPSIRFLSTHKLFALAFFSGNLPTFKWHSIPRYFLVFPTSFTFWESPDQSQCCHMIYTGSFYFHKFSRKHSRRAAQRVSYKAYNILRRDSRQNW